MFEGFKKFIARGNMIDMAVGVVMGGAVTTVVNSIVNSVINPFKVFRHSRIQKPLQQFGSVPSGSFLTIICIAAARRYGSLS